MTQILEILPFPLLSVIPVTILLLQPFICCQQRYRCTSARLPRNIPKIRKRFCRQQYSECQLCVAVLFLLPEHLIQESKVTAQAGALPVSTEIPAAVSVTAADAVGGVPTADLCPVLVLLLGWVCIQLLGENFTWKRGKTGKNSVMFKVQCNRKCLSTK